MIRAFRDPDLAAVYALQLKCPHAAQWCKEDYSLLAADAHGMILVAEIETLARVSHSAEPFSSGQQKGGTSVPPPEEPLFALPSPGPRRLEPQAARAGRDKSNCPPFETAGLEPRPSRCGEESGPERSEVVGFAAFYRVNEEAELRNLAVDPAHQRRGVARSLLQEGIRRLKESGVRRIFLEVRASNHPAITLYASLGFRLHATRKEYYQHPVEDASLMALDILPPFKAP